MSFKPLRAIVSMVAALAMLYVAYGTFGTTLMVFKATALDLLTKIHLNAAWMGIAAVSANNIDYWFGSIWVFGVAIIVYTALTLISSTDSDRAVSG